MGVLMKRSDAPISRIYSKIEFREIEALLSERMQLIICM